MDNIYIGWDSREDIAYQVASHSIHKLNPNINIEPIKQNELRERGWYAREVDARASTEFTFTRFLVPIMNNFKGWAMFVDCDFLFLSDPAELFEHAKNHPDKAVHVVQHNYTPTETTKMDGQTQHLYPRKNWSSMILFNCAHPSNRALTLENINTKSGAWLHRFQWLDDSEIGSVGPEWNWLVGWYKEPGDGKPKALHYTEGGPYFKHHFECEYHNEWKDAYYNMTGKFWTKEDILD